MISLRGVLYSSSSDSLCDVSSITMQWFSLIGLSLEPLMALEVVVVAAGVFLDLVFAVDEVDLEPLSFTTP